MTTDPAPPAPFVTTALPAEAFLHELDAQNATALARIAQKTAAGEPPPELTIAKLLVLALKNELEATECAAAWISSTDDVDVKLALARQAGDEAKHYRLIERRLRALGVETEGTNPLAAGVSPLLRYLLNLRGTVARVAAGQFTREALAVVRNEAFVALCDARGDAETAALYRETIQPDEHHHHQLGRSLLERLAVTADAQQEARVASARVLEMAEELQEIARLKMGVQCAPGC